MFVHPMDTEDLEIAAIARPPNDHSQQLLHMYSHPKDREDVEI